MPYNSGFIATAGRYGSSVGKMVLEIDTETGSITSVSGTQQITDHPGKCEYHTSKYLLLAIDSIFFHAFLCTMI